MKRVLRLSAGILVAGAAIFWAAAGANTGWTQTLVEKRTLDEVTGIEGISYEKRFVPGVDFLGGAVLAAGCLAGASLFVPSRKPETKT